jgi:hypothetical protein
MCNDKNSAGCVEVNYYMNKNYINSTSLINVIKLVKKDRKKIRRKIMGLYLRCIFKFHKLLMVSNEKRYQPGGNGYLEAKRHFEKIVN